MEAQVNFSDQSRLENWPVTIGSTDKFVIPAPSVQACKFLIPETWWWIGDIPESLESFDYFWRFWELCTRLGCRLSTAFVKNCCGSSAVSQLAQCAVPSRFQHREDCGRSFFFLVHNNACYNASRTDKEKPWPLSWLVLVREMVQLSRLGVYYDWYWRISGLHSISGAVIKGSRIGMCAGAVTLAVDILSLRSNNQRETTWRVWWLVLAHLWLTFYLWSYDQRESPWHECWCCNISGWHSNVEEPWPKMY